MKHLFILFFLMILPLLANANDAIEGYYQVQTTSYRTNKYGVVRTYDSLEYSSLFYIMITDNLDGTYHVDDLFGGYYSFGMGYGTLYAMGGDIMIADDGTVWTQWGQAPLRHFPKRSIYPSDLYKTMKIIFTKFVNSKKIVLSLQSN